MEKAPEMSKATAMRIRVTISEIDRQEKERLERERVAAVTPQQLTLQPAGETLADSHHETALVNQEVQNAESKE